MNYWAQSYHAEGSIWCTAVQKTTSGFILVGNAGDPGAMGASCVFLIMKLDANGKPKWRKTFHHIPYFRQATCIQEVNGNYFVAGYTIEQGNYATLVIKLNAKGIASWTKIFASSEYHTIPSSMLDTHDGGVAIAGRIEEVQTSNQDFWVLKLNANGDYEWQKAYDYRYFVGQDLRRANETAISIARTVGGGYIVAGNLSTQLGDNDLWILELDSFGNLGSNTRIGGQGNDQVTSMVLTSNHSPDPAFVLAGFTNSVGDGSFNMFAAKCQFIAPQPPLLARIGVLWGKAYELYGPDYGYSIDQTTDGDFVLAGSCYMPQTNSLDALILKLRSADGSFIWSRGYGGHLHDDGFYSVQKTSGNGFVMGGYNESFPVSKSVNPFTRSLTYRKNAWVMNLDKDGYIDKTNNNDACMLLYRTDPQQVLGLDWIPKCPEKPGPEEKITSIQPVGVESTPSDLKVKSILLCKELKP